jgi:hypothetical protein
VVREGVSVAPENVVPQARQAKYGTFPRVPKATPRPAQTGQAS